MPALSKYSDFRRTTDGFYSYTVGGKTFWGYEKKHRGERRQREGFESKTEARVDRKEWMDRIDALGGRTSRMTVKQLCGEWLAAHKPEIKESTHAEYEKDLRNHIEPALGELAISDLRPAHISDLLTEIASGSYKRSKQKGAAEYKRTNRTANRALAPLRAALGYAVRMGYLSYSPAAAVKRLPERPRERRFLKLAEAESILAKCEGRDLALVAMALGSGMREGEIVALKWGDLDLERSIAMVRRNFSHGRMGTPKDHQVRAVVLPEWLRLVLIDYYRAGGSPGPDAWLFPAIRGKAKEMNLPIRGDVAYKRFTEAAARAEISGVNFHAMRHSYATIMLDAGAVPLAVAELLGHANTDTTHRFYAHFIRDHEGLKADVDKWLDLTPGNRRDGPSQANGDGAEEKGI